MSSSAIQTNVISFIPIYLSLFLPLKISYLYAQEVDPPNNTITLTTYYPAPFGAYKKMTISDSVGIGTTSPAVKLHVSAPTGSQSIYLTTEDNDGTSGLALWFGNNYANLVNWAGLGMDNSDNSLRLSTTGSRGTATVTIKPNGSVGIGTTDPQAKLDIGGTPGVDGIRFPDGTVQTTDAGNFNGGWVSVDPCSDIPPNDQVVAMGLVPVPSPKNGMHYKGQESPSGGGCSNTFSKIAIQGVSTICPDLTWGWKKKAPTQWIGCYIIEVYAVDVDQ